MNNHRTGSAVLILLIAATTLLAIDGIPSVVPAMLIVASSALTLHDYGRRGGNPLSMPPSARVIASGSTVVAAAIVLLLAGFGRPWMPPFIRVALFVIATGVALLGAGVRYGAAEARGAGARPPAQDSQFAFLAAMACAVGATIDNTFAPQGFPAMAAAFLLIGYSRRPATVSAAPSVE